MKISREGIVLIKSFEGFRPRAIRREEGGWIIGYGHTLSAREGATVSEADAELLLRYDLLPVEKSVNAAGSAVLNQHQFDALVSFVHSVGVDRFQSSDVLSHLAQGAAGQAADAMLGWPEPALPQAALRRRAAERALFKADPEAPVAVSDLLAAPIDLAPPASSPMADPDAASAPETASEAVGAPTSADPHDADPRTVAVSMLLGETEEVVLPTFAPPPPLPEAAVEREATTEAFPEPANDLSGDLPIGSGTTSPAEETTDQAKPVSGNSDPIPAADAPALSARLPADRIAPTIQRYTPYAGTMVGPLPFLQPALHPVVEAAPTSATDDTSQPSAVMASPILVESQPATEPSPFSERVDVEPLVLSPLDDVPAPTMTRAPWTPAERADADEATDGGLFGEDLSLTQGGAPILRHGEIEFEAPASFDWSETGAFVIMGAVGLTAFGAAMAAFRLAAEQSGGDETTIIAWVLALIGAGCVGVSSFNLYRRWGLPGGDN